MKSYFLYKIVFPLLMVFFFGTEVFAQFQNQVQNSIGVKLPRIGSNDKFSCAFQKFLKAFEDNDMDLHSVMVLQNGNVIAECWLNDWSPEKPHVLWSVSKTFTATAVGFAVAENRFKISDKVISFFSEELPEKISDNLRLMTVGDLLTMTCGLEKEPPFMLEKNKKKNTKLKGDDWVRTFLATPVIHKPGSFFQYNSMATYMLSAIVQKTTGEKLIDYLKPRLFEPLGFFEVKWDESPYGVNTGGWGLYLRTEDMAKLGQLFLQNGKWNGKQLLSESWIKAASSKQVSSVPGNYFITEDKKKELENNDWFQGYGYQMWRSRYNTFRADGMRGQFIIVIPEKNAVVTLTADIALMPKEIDFVWKYLLPAL